MKIPELPAPDSGGYRMIRAKYTCRCDHCHQRIDAGDQAWWHRARRAMIHPECYDALGVRHVDQLTAEDGWWEKEPESEEQQWPLFPTSGDIELTPF